MVTDTGGIDDKSFNATTWSGIQAAQAKLNIETRYIQSTDASDYAKNINAFINSGCEVIVGCGWNLSEAMNAAASENPKVLFSGVDFEFTPSLPNTVGQVYQSDEAAFLAGYLAAGMSQTGKVGVYGGMNFPSVTIFMDGYARGVEYYNQKHNTKVQVIGWNTRTLQGLFTDTFTDLDLGKMLANDLIIQGVDVIFPVAGPLGVGSAQAIEDHGGDIWLIGVDSDWTQTQPEFAPFILTSVVKKMDFTTYAVIEGIWSGNFSSGNYVGTLANGGVGIATPPVIVPRDLMNEIREVGDAIISGKIVLNPNYKAK
jgi:basic membrane protein A